MSKRKEIHDRVLNAASTDELMAAYREWADKYDDDLLNEMGYVAPIFTCKLLQTYLFGKDAYILDAGCGTGLVGALMHKDGYRNIEGIDYSRHMLDKAREKDVYQALHQADLTQPLKMPDDTYDAIVSVGIFTCGHVGPDALDELARITKPGGVVCFTVREQAWEEDDYPQRLRDMENNDIWELHELRTTDYIKQEGARCKVCLYKISA